MSRHKKTIRTPQNALVVESGVCVVIPTGVELVRPNPKHMRQKTMHCNSRIDVIIETVVDMHNTISFVPQTERAMRIIGSYKPLTDNMLLLSASDCESLFRVIDENELNTRTMG